MVMNFISLFVLRSLEDTCENPRNSRSFRADLFVKHSADHCYL